ncbi:hypothetical protein [Phocaeicola sp.]
MKLKMIFLTTVLFLSASCSKEETKTDNDLIKLSAYSVQLLAGEEYQIEILEKTKDWELIDENPEIVSGWWTNNGKTIRIKGEGIGTASVYLIDRQNSNRNTEIKVSSEYFFGNYQEEGDKAEFQVHVLDKSVQNEIENSLKEIAQNRSGTTYSFDKNTKNVTIAHGNNKLISTYEWDIKSLTIHTDGNNQQYRFISAGNSSINLYMNLKEEFKEKYPNVSIYEVGLWIHLSRL